jgi:hypothetical protein
MSAQILASGKANRNATVGSGFSRDAFSLGSDQEMHRG